MIQDYQLDNILTKQKDKLIQLIDETKTLPELLIVAETVNILAELWDTCHYGYKKDELIERIKRKIDTYGKTNKQDKVTTSSSRVSRKPAKEGS